jgi:cytochrome c553
MRISMNRIILATILALGISTTASAQVGDAASGAQLITACNACHGESGNQMVIPGAAKIGGQHAQYLLKQLQDIKAGTREITLMAGQLNNFDDQDLADIAAYYASQQAPSGAAQADSLELGQTLYRSGNADLGVAACTACHSPTGSGNAGAGYPVLSGQDAAYTETQLRAFRDGTRNNDLASVMRSNVERLTDAEIRALASYVSGLRMFE